MNEMSTQKITCYHCGASFYLQEKGVKKVLCGDDLVCNPPNENYDAPDCKIYHFCSDDCLDKEEAKLASCELVPRWKRLMKNIGKVSSDCEVAGARVHNLKMV